MKAIATLVQALEQPTEVRARDLLSPETRMVRLMTFRLGEDLAARELLKAAVRDFAALEAALERARADEDETGLDEAAFPLSGFPQACRQHPALLELFPAER